MRSGWDERRGGAYDNAIFLHHRDAEVTEMINMRGIIQSQVEIHGLKRHIHSVWRIA